jgi:Glycosyltransferase 61
MTKPLTSAKRRATRTFRSALRGLERPLLAHPDSRFEAAPAHLARYASGSQINKRDNVRYWREEASQEHRSVTQPGVVTISDAGLIGHTRQSDAEHKSLQAIVNIIDSSGRPLFFPFKKRWNLKSSLKHLDLLFAGNGEGLQGKVALLGSSQVSFYHFVTEVVGDWWFLKQMGYRESDFSAIVVHGHRKDWQEEILDMLRIPADKRRYHFEVKARHIDLVVPYRTKGDAVTVPAWMCNALRSELGKGLGQRAGARKIYVSRKDASRRRMINEADMTERLKKLGFEIRQLEGMTIAEQQALFGSARVVVAEHGAALTNIAWCPANAAVVDIHPTVPAMPCFKILAELRGVRYLPVFVARSEDLERDDWSISAEAIERVLDAVAVALKTEEAATT